VKARGAIVAKRETPQHLRVMARIASQMARALLSILPRGFLRGVLGSGSIIPEQHTRTDRPLGGSTRDGPESPFACG